MTIANLRKRINDSDIGQYVNKSLPGILVEYANSVLFGQRKVELGADDKNPYADSLVYLTRGHSDGSRTVERLPLMTVLRFYQLNAELEWQAREKEMESRLLMRELAI